MNYPRFLNALSNSIRDMHSLESLFRRAGGTYYEYQRGFVHRSLFLYQRIWEILLNCLSENRNLTLRERQMLRRYARQTTNYRNTLRQAPQIPLVNEMPIEQLIRRIDNLTERFYSNEDVMFVNSIQRFSRNQVIAYIQVLIARCADRSRRCRRMLRLRQNPNNTSLLQELNDDFEAITNDLNNQEFGQI